MQAELEIIKNVHISTIVVGDAVKHQGKVRTVGAKDIKRCPFMGKTLFGDSYSLGNTSVKKVIVSL